MYNIIARPLTLSKPTLVAHILPLITPSLLYKCISSPEYAKYSINDGNDAICITLPPIYILYYLSDRLGKKYHKCLKCKDWQGLSKAEDLPAIDPEDLEAISLDEFWRLIDENQNGDSIVREGRGKTCKVDRLLPYVLENKICAQVFNKGGYHCREFSYVGIWNASKWSKNDGNDDW